MTGAKTKYSAKAGSAWTMRAIFMVVILHRPVLGWESMLAGYEPNHCQP